MTERGGDIEVIPCVGQRVIGLESRSFPCVKEEVEGGWRKGRNESSIGGAQRQDDALDCRWETVP